MTLVKEKPHRIPPEHRKRIGQHHHHSHHYLKTYWPYLPMSAILLVGLIANGWLGHLHRSVLGYATDMSIQTLLDDTNAQRASNSISGLAINAQLDSAAQAKANDMAARDYWSHNTPDGQTPWSFIIAAGYNYQTAGENLAYGFASAGDTITGWMDSPEHRANMLNTTYHDVGFGFVNIPNYQNAGPETLVVAMYGSLATPAVAAATPTYHPPEPVPSPAAAAPALTSQPPVQLDPAVATTKPAAATPDPRTAQPAAEPQQQPISRFQLVAANTPANTLALITLATVGALFIALRHGLAWKRVLVRGERLVLYHPLLDIAAISLITLSLVLSHTAGLIR